MERWRKWAIGLAIGLVALVGALYATVYAVVAYGFYTYTVVGIAAALALMIFAAWPWLRRGKAPIVLSVMAVALAAPTVAQAGVNWGAPNEFFHTNAWMNVWEEVSNPDTTTAAKCHVYGQAFWGGDERIDAVNRDFYCNAKGPWTVSTNLTAKSGRIHNCHNKVDYCWTGHAEWDVKVNYPIGPTYICHIFATARIKANTNGPWYDFWDNGGGGAAGGVC